MASQLSEEVHPDRSIQIDGVLEGLGGLPIVEASC